MERELANVVYIFTNTGEMGIKFYDRTPEGVVSEITGTLPKGKFQTDIYSISNNVTWDSSINKPNQSQLIKTRGGSYIATTFIVSSEKLMRILKAIEDSEDKRRIIIDVVENQYTSDKSYDLTELAQLKKELLSEFSNLQEYKISEDFSKNIK